MIRYILDEAKLLLSDIYKSRNVIFELSRREFKIMFGDKYLGFIWAVLEPIAMMFILVIVFTYLRGRTGGDGVPFPVFLLSGVIGFEFFNKSFNRATMSVKSYSFIVRRGRFRMSILPMVNILFNFQTHLIVLVVSAVIFMWYGIYPNWYWLQLPYYFIATSVLLVGMTWISSALLIFVTDVQYITGILMRVLFFLTPIFYELSMFPESLQAYFKINPMYHIVMGYRNCILYEKPFWSDMYSFISFWVITSIILIIGGYTFRRLRPHFDDVL